MIFQVFLYNCGCDYESNFGSLEAVSIGGLSLTGLEIRRLKWMVFRHAVLWQCHPTGPFMTFQCQDIEKLIYRGDNGLPEHKIFTEFIFYQQAWQERHAEVIKVRKIRHQHEQELNERVR